MKIHKLKTWPEFFWQVQRGDKKFEYRKDDRGFRPGDILQLELWDPAKNEYLDMHCSVKVIDVHRSLPGMPLSHCVMQIEHLDQVREEINLADIHNELHKRDLLYEILNYHDSMRPENDEIIRVKVWKKVYKKSISGRDMVVKSKETWGLEILADENPQHQLAGFAKKILDDLDVLEASKSTGGN